MNLRRIGIGCVAAVGLLGACASRSASTRSPSASNSPYDSKFGPHGEVPSDRTTSADVHGSITRSSAVYTGTNPGQRILADEPERQASDTVPEPGKTVPPR